MSLSQSSAQRAHLIGGGQMTEDFQRELYHHMQVEKIRQLRLEYSYYMDVRDLDHVADLYTEDALCEFGPYGSWHGRETIRENFRQVFVGDLAPKFSSLHYNTNHMVWIDSDTQARGVCYLLDIETFRAADQNSILWHAVYDEDYRKLDGKWKIKRSSIQFFWPERHAQDADLVIHR